MPPKLYIKNALKAALDGLGDGTVYASASAVVNQAQKTFVLSGLSIFIADIGANVDDKFNSHTLYFPASGNKYTIVDWVASSNTATVYETPSLVDSGACEIRRVLTDPGTIAANPTKFLADGRRGSKWKRSGGQLDLTVSLSNLFTGGGFERGSLGTWGLSPIGGTSDTSGVKSASPILGTYDVLMDRGDRTQVFLFHQMPVNRIRPGGVYRLLFKARSNGTFVQSKFRISFDSQGVQANSVLFSNPSSGAIVNGRWEPVFTGTNTWYFCDVTIPASPPTNYRILFDIRDSAAFTVSLDEITMFEIIKVSSLIIFDGIGGGYASLNVRGSRCPTDRTGFVAGTDDVSLYSNLNPMQDVREIGFGEAIYPTYTITGTPGFQQLTGAAEILLSEVWQWDKGPNRPFGLNSDTLDITVNTTSGGQQEEVIHHKKRKFQNTLPILTEADRLRLINDFKPHHWQTRQPFGLVIQTGDEVLFMKETGMSFDPTYRNIRPDWAFNFEEVL